MIYLIIFLWFVSFIIGTAILRAFLFTEYKIGFSDAFISIFLGVIGGWLVIIMAIIAAIFQFLCVLIDILLQVVTRLFEDINN